VTDKLGDAALLDRERELEALSAWVSETLRGRGRFVLVQAGPGLGKTAYLERAADLASRSGLRTLAARGSELEREMPFGGVRQLFEAALAGLDRAEQLKMLTGAAAAAASVVGPRGETSDVADPLGVIHGLYWLASNLSSAGPLLLTIDDIHWSDPQTLRWLSYISPRIEDLPMLVLAAVRPGEPIGTDLSGDVSQLVHEMVDAPRVTTVPLAPLSLPAVHELIRTQLDGAGDLEFARACHDAAGGNPFFVRELIRASAADRIAPSAENARLVLEVGVSEIARSILVRLARLGDHSRRLATAVAILGSDAELRYAAALSGLTLDDALTSWDTLTAGEILQSRQPLQFIHPIARTAIYGELGTGERSRAHRRAAELLGAPGADAQRVAVHAFACEPAGDAEIVTWLRKAARDAVTGAPDAAARLLGRALEEPPVVGARRQVQFELGQALIGLDSERAAESFAGAALSEDPDLRLLAFRWMGYALAYAGRIGEALVAFDRAIELARDDREAVLHTVGTRDFYASWWPDDPDRMGRHARLHELAGALEGSTRGERRLIAIAAMNSAHTGFASADEAQALAGRIDRSRLTYLDLEDGNETASAIEFLDLLCDAPEAVDDYETALAEVASRGWLINLGVGRTNRAHAAFRQGKLLDAEADARAGWEILGPLGDSVATPYWMAASVLVEVLLARGAMAEGEALVRSTGLGTETLDVAVFPWPPVVRGEVELAAGRAREGITILLEAGAWLEARGFTNPSKFPWRALVAPALATSGRRAQAREVISPALERARSFGAPWALGMALRAAGTVEQGQDGIDLLREAVKVLERSPCRGEHAYALLELGAALRRSNRRTEAREHLRAALDLASRCGAAVLAGRARDELVAAGARPRREMLSGAESLTASERRVAELAAAGHSNPEIAQQLFVTRKTVETHLGHVYLKLDIQGRTDISGALSQ
jgi:DNA-binding CsgD family transcriptional regulator